MSIYILIKSNISFFFFGLAPFRPGNINVTSSSNSVNISWEPPKQETGPTRYLVKAIDKETLTLTSSCQTQGY